MTVASVCRICRLPSSCPISLSRSSPGLVLSCQFMPCGGVYDFLPSVVAQGCLSRPRVTDFVSEGALIFLDPSPPRMIPTSFSRDFFSPCGTYWPKITILTLTYNRPSNVLLICLQLIWSRLHCAWKVPEAQSHGPLRSTAPASCQDYLRSPRIRLVFRRSALPISNQAWFDSRFLFPSSCFFPLRDVL